MYAPSSTYKNLVKELSGVVGSKARASLIVHVEMTLLLAIHLRLEAEPLTVGWVLLSQIPIHHPLLNSLSPQQCRMRANAAMLVPLSSRFAWEHALVRYAKDIPAHIRLFAVQPTPLHDQMITCCRQSPSPDPLREARYEKILTEPLPYENRTRHYVKANETYKVRAQSANGEKLRGTIQITPSMLSESEETWFDAPRPRTVIEITMQELMPTAQFLDEHEQRSGGRVHWVHDLKQIRFRKAFVDNGKLNLHPENDHPLRLEGAVHLPGTVSAGKTTLAKLIIAHCIRQHLDIRITLIVGDSHTAIQIAHQVNSWFYDDPSQDDVIAVPILGFSQREVHLRRLLESREYTRERPHWGERWLMPVCPLASQMVWEGEVSGAIRAGSEPCESLRQKPPRSKKGKEIRHLCPLFRHCPSKQLYRDMPRAKLWVTTPGAFTQAALPLHLDTRIAKMGDLIYEQSDLVIFDEVDTIVDWLDKTFARREALTSGGNGLLDELDPQVADYWNTNRVLPPDHRRWVIAARESLKALTGVLTAIADHDQERVVKKWVKRGQFSPNSLAYRLARRLAGLKEWDSTRVLPEERHQHETLTQPIFAPFDELFNQTPDPLRRQSPPDSNNPADELARLMQAINNLADDVTDEDIFLQVRDWILKWHPDIETRLETLREQLQQSDDSYDETYLHEHLDRSVDDLALRLQFLLTVALLDRHIHIVIQEWHNKPESLEAEQPFSRIPRGMQHILPLPLTGQQYGFVIDQSKDDHAANRLSLFMYKNIGRSYLLNFHRLREDLEDTPGPHILALSGTSYLPDSTAFHVTLPPAGILMPSPQTEAALRQSRFIWQYFKDEKGKPIQVSGRPDKEQQLRVLMEAMLKYGGTPGGFLGSILTWLEAQGNAQPDLWGDRARILMLTNSYTQARRAAGTLREKWYSEANNIFHLKRGRDSEDYEIQGSELQRIDIELFASTGGRILVAPMQSIGRGFNILNRAAEPKAAFGVVLFLTRPMNVPGDVEAHAQELNRYALEWAANPAFPAWGEDTLYRCALKAREKAAELRRMIETRYGYESFRDDALLGVFPRRDLAATTTGRIVQAVGRLMRGGVPFLAYFVDAAWSPQLARTDEFNAVEPEETSLLTAMINILNEYVFRDAIGLNLYGGLSEALVTTENRDSN